MYKKPTKAMLAKAAQLRKRCEYNVSGKGVECGEECPASDCQPAKYVYQNGGKWCTDCGRTVWTNRTRCAYCGGIYD